MHVPQVLPPALPTATTRRLLTEAVKRSESEKKSPAASLAMATAKAVAAAAMEAHRTRAALGRAASLAEANVQAKAVANAAMEARRTPAAATTAPAFATERSRLHDFGNASRLRAATVAAPVGGYFYRHEKLAEILDNVPYGSKVVIAAAMDKIESRDVEVSPGGAEAYFDKGGTARVGAQGDIETVYRPGWRLPYMGDGDEFDQDSVSDYECICSGARFGWRV